jgi:hypothetical protein
MSKIENSILKPAKKNKKSRLTNLVRAFFSFFKLVTIFFFHIFEKVLGIFSVII